MALGTKPTGWFQIGYGADIAVGAVVAMRYFDRELVAFREHDGRLHVLDAHCGHLGAHLGHGGCVTVDGIQCPFHGWVWSGDGRNVRIPYEERPSAARRLRSWPVVEKNEVVYLWHDASGRPPLWSVPDVFADLAEHARGREYHPALPEGRILFAGVKVHPQYVIENAVDRHHFRFVHHLPQSPVILEHSANEWTWRFRAGFGKRWAAGTAGPGDTLGTLTTLFSGLALGYNAAHEPEGVSLILIATTPVDAETSNVFGTFWLERIDADANPGNYERRLAVQKAALPDDVRIWQHQRYVEHPPFTHDEAKGWRELRRWTARFYPEADASGVTAEE